MRIIHWLDAAVRAVAAALLVAMTALVLVDVFWRYFLNTPLGAPQELSVMCMVWVVMLGAATAVRRGSHVSITFFVNALPPAARRAAGLFSNLVMLAVFFLMVSQGWTVVVRGMRQASTVTGIRHGYVALAIPVCGALAILFILDRMLFRRTGGGEQETATAPGAATGEDITHA